MSESDVSSSASRSGAVGKPPDPCWQFFDKVCEPNALGELIAQLLPCKATTVGSIGDVVVVLK